MLGIIFLVIATEAVTQILLDSELFERPRQFLSRVWLFRELLKCPWCSSVWVATGICLLTYFGYGIVIVPFVIHRLANIFHDLYGLLKRIRWGG